MKVYYIDRKSGERVEEKVYGAFALKVLYGGSKILAHLISRFGIVSYLYGFLQRMPWTRRKVQPFIETYGLDEGEFEKRNFTSFNDFFIRKLKEDARPIDSAPLICPADGRYYSFEKALDSFVIKGRPYTLEELVGNRDLAERYMEGPMVIARLCPSDYHRFHFPSDGTPSVAERLPGPLYSVNPIALKWRPSILAKNKRMITRMEADFGNYLIVEVGATCVGSIHQTYAADQRVKKGDEKGYFSFGGSAMVLLFEPGTIQLSDDLLREDEVRCQMGQPLGH